MDAVLTKLIEFADRHERIIDVLSTAWFVISCASWMPFLPIPEIPYVTDKNFWVASGIWNVAWWGFAHPIINSHREKMAKLEQGEAEPGAEQS